jgi:hypothetical protein
MLLIHGLTCGSLCWHGLTYEIHGIHEMHEIHENHEMMHGILQVKEVRSAPKM